MHAGECQAFHAALTITTAGAVDGFVAIVICLPMARCIQVAAAGLKRPTNKSVNSQEGGEGMKDLNWEGVQPV